MRASFVGRSSLSNNELRISYSEHQTLLRNRSTLGVHSAHLRFLPSLFLKTLARHNLSPLAKHTGKVRITDVDTRYTQGHDVLLPSFSSSIPFFAHGRTRNLVQDLHIFGGISPAHLCHVCCYCSCQRLSGFVWVCLCLSLFPTLWRGSLTFVSRHSSIGRFFRAPSRKV